MGDSLLKKKEKKRGTLLGKGGRVLGALETPPGSGPGKHFFQRVRGFGYICKVKGKVGTTFEVRLPSRAAP